MTKKTIAVFVSVVVLALVGIAVFAANETSQAQTNVPGITNTKIINAAGFSHDRGMDCEACEDCDGNCEECCEDCDGNCEDCDACDRNCEGHGEGHMCGGHVKSQGYKPGMCGGHGCGI